MGRTGQSHGEDSRHPQGLVQVLAGHPHMPGQEEELGWGTRPHREGVDNNKIQLLEDRNSPPC